MKNCKKINKLVKTKNWRSKTRCLNQEPKKKAKKLKPWTKTRILKHKSKNNE